MDTNLTHTEALITDGHTYSKEDALADLEKVHNVYRDVLNAFVRSCIVNHIMVSKDDIEQAMEGVGEALAHEAGHALEHLPNESYTPDNARHLIEIAEEAIADGQRVKPVLDAIFRPQHNRGNAPRNPATLVEKGEL